MKYKKQEHAQIVATIGPASQKEGIVRKLIESGMDVARLNFSWGNSEEHTVVVGTIREAARSVGRHIPIIADLSGPRIQEKSGHEFDIHFKGRSDGVITAKDLRDLDLGAKLNVDYVAMSYVGSEADIVCLKKEMAVRGLNKPVIAKIERREALENLDGIIAAADAIMVARGDLGNEVPLETIPFVQLDIIKRAKKAGKPVITATQMMLSMTENPMPTRAEVSDVAFAIIEGSDAVMLSEESANGKYPVEAVSMMKKIILEAERHEYKPVVRRL